MKTTSFTVTTNAPQSALFGYLSDPTNLPEWATEFCQDMETTATGYRVSTPMGPMNFSIAADANTGVIDMFAYQGNTPECGMYTRVVSQPLNRSAWTVTFTPSADQPE